jgi:hypothetical protein
MGGIDFDAINEAFLAFSCVPPDFAYAVEVPAFRHSSGSISFDRLKRSQILSFCAYSRVQRDNLNYHNCTSRNGVTLNRKAGDQIEVQCRYCDLSDANC